MGRPPLDRSIVGILVAFFASTAGATIAATTVGIQTYALTGRELDLGLLGLIQFLPAALLVLVVGSVADRFDRSKVCAIGALLQAAAGLGLAVNAAMGTTGVTPIFLLIFVFGVGRAFVATVLRALPADVVPPAHLPWLVTRRVIASQVSIIGGAPLAGLLYTIDPTVPYLVLTLTLVVSAVGVSVVTPSKPAAAVPSAPPPTPVSSEPDAEVLGPAVPRMHEALAGLRFIRSSSILLSIISLDLFAVLFGGAIALLPAIAEDRLGAGPAGIGVLRAAGGVGGAAVLILLAVRPLTRRVGPTLLLCVGLFGLGTVVLGATTDFAVALVAMAFISGADVMSVYIRSTVVPLVTPPETRGRVSAVESMFIGASNELGAFESGATGEWLGSSGAVIVGGTATVIVATAYWVRAPALRSLDSFPNASGDRPGPAAP